MGEPRHRWARVPTHRATHKSKGAPSAKGALTNSPGSLRELPLPIIRSDQTQGSPRAPTLLEPVTGESGPGEAGPRVESCWGWGQGVPSELTWAALTSLWDIPHPRPTLTWARWHGSPSQRGPLRSQVKHKILKPLSPHFPQEKFLISDAHLTTAQAGGVAGMQGWGPVESSDSGKGAGAGWNARLGAEIPRGQRGKSQPARGSRAVPRPTVYPPIQSPPSISCITPNS